MARDTMTKKERDIENNRRSHENLPRLGEEPAGGFRGFINVDLSDKQKADFPGWWDSQDISEHLAFYCAGGVVLSIKADKKSGGFLASATDKSEGQTNSGLATTARARNPFTALQRLLYTLALLGDDWAASSPVKDPDRW